MQDYLESPVSDPQATQRSPATPFDFKLEALSDTVGKFYYKQPASDIPIKRWEIERSEDSFATSPFNRSIAQLEIAFTERRRTWAGMKPDTAYAFRIRTRGVNNVASPWSEIVLGHTLGLGGVPSTPKKLRILANTGQRLDLTWEACVAATSIKEYSIYRDGRVVGRVPGEHLTFQDSGLKPGALYTYVVVACDQAGQVSTPSATLSARTKGSNGQAQWQVNQRYEIGDIVTHQGSLWQCVQAHVAYSPDWAPGLPGIEVLWQLLG